MLMIILLALLLEFIVSYINYKSGYYKLIIDFDYSLDNVINNYLTALLYLIIIIIMISKVWCAWEVKYNNNIDRAVKVAILVSFVFGSIILILYDFNNYRHEISVLIVINYSISLNLILYSLIAYLVTLLYIILDLLLTIAFLYTLKDQSNTLI